MDLSDFKQLLKDLNCPLLLKDDSWWLEGILFKPGKARKDLLLWSIEQLSQATKQREEHATITSSTEGKSDSTTETSTVSSGTGVPENDEGLLKYCLKVGLCAPGDLDLISGEASVGKQTEFWTTLLTSLRASSLTNMELTRSLNTLSAIMQSSSFLELFKLRSDLIPSVLKIELKQRNKTLTVEELRSEVLNSQNEGHASREEECDNVLPADSYVKLLDVQSRLQSAATVFVQSCGTDLRGQMLDASLPDESKDLGATCRALNEDISNWSQRIGSLQTLQSNMDELKDKAKTHLQTNESNTVTDVYLGELCKVWLK